MEARAGNSILDFETLFSDFQELLINGSGLNVVRLDAEVDIRDSVNMHRLDVWCFYESSRTFEPAVGLGTSISDVKLPPPELRKVAHIPPSA